LNYFAAESRGNRKHMMIFVPIIVVVVSHIL